jgi:hypothetical protein
MKCDMKCDISDTVSNILDTASNTISNMENIIHPNLYNFLYMINHKLNDKTSELYSEYSPGCPAADEEDSCIYMLGCSWCPTIGCTYKDVADLLPIEYICYSAIGISGEPEEYHLFLFKYGRVKPPKVSR